MGGTASAVSSALVLVALVAVSTQGGLLAVLALGAAVVLGLLMAVGPDRVGTWVVLLGVTLAPMNDLRPTTGSVTISDLALALGFLLLMPAMILGRPRIPMLFALGSFGVLVSSVISSLLAPDPSGSLALALRLIIAGSLLPLLFLLWRPDRRTLRLLAWGYVVGQLINTGIAVAEGDGRVMGATVHPNALAIDGLIASVLLLYLWHEVDRSRRWLVLAAGTVCVYSIVASGSRGALLALVLVWLLYPVVERSAASALSVLAVTLLALPAVTWLASRAGDDSALGRLVSDDQNVTGSDTVRREEIGNAIDRFLASPIVGNGFDAHLLHPHNVFLQVAVAAGVVGLASYLVLLSSFTTVLFGSAPDRRLGYVMLAYLAVGMTQPSLWERNIWAALCLTIVAASALPEKEPEAAPAADSRQDA